MKKKILIVLWLLGSFLVAKAQSSNQIIGVGAGANITTGSFNTMYGDSTGHAGTTASRLTLIGYKAGQFNDQNDLVAIGYKAGYFNTEGEYNTFIGTEAGVGKSLSTPMNGNDNTVVGTKAGFILTTAYSNTFFGEESGAYITTGYENTIIGEQNAFDGGEYSGFRSVFVGSQAGQSFANNYANVGIGGEALWDVDEGHHNTALGDSAQTDLGDGIYNVAIGQGAGANTEYADYGTFIGSIAGWDNNRTNNTNDANRNTYAGFATGFANRQGQDNVGLGALANYDNNVRNKCTFIGANLTVSQNDVLSVGYNSFVDNQFGVGIGNEQDQRNGTGAIAIGHGVSSRNTNTEHSIAIGYLADFDEIDFSKSKSIGIGNVIKVSSSETVAIGSKTSALKNNSVAIGDSVQLNGQNSIAIGSKLILAANNEVFIGNAATTTIGSSVNWTATSDARFKKNVEENIPGLEFINKLRPVTYQFDVNKLASVLGANAQDLVEKGIQVYSGFIAQEVEKAAVEIAYDFSGVKVPSDTAKGIYGLRYAEFTVPLVKAIQELSSVSTDQKNQLSNSMTLIAAQREHVQSLSRELVTLQSKLELLELEVNPSSIGKNGEIILITAR